MSTVNAYACRSLHAGTPELGNAAQPWMHVHTRLQNMTVARCSCLFATSLVAFSKCTDEA